MIFVKTADCRTDMRSSQASESVAAAKNPRARSIEARGEIAHLEFSTEGAVLEGGEKDADLFDSF